MRHIRFVLSVIAVVACAASAFAFTVEPVPEWNELFDAHRVTGVVLVYDDSADRYYSSAPLRINDRFLPASTFKVLSSLIALETRVVSDETQIIPWNRTEREVATWNRDMDMREAIACSAVWVYQELARKIGPERMNFWVRRANYGNGNTGGAIDSFWLDGNLRVSPLEQLEFMRRLKTGRLPFSKRNLDIVRNSSSAEKKRMGDHPGRRAPSRKPSPRRMVRGIRRKRGQNPLFRHARGTPGSCRHRSGARGHHPENPPRPERPLNRTSDARNAKAGRELPPFRGKPAILRLTSVPGRAIFPCISHSLRHR